MTTIWVALLRGINVGGNRKLPMVTLCEIATRIGYENVRHYIQSGNLVFHVDEPDSAKPADAIYAEMGIRPEVMLVAGESFLRIAGQNPFPAGLSDPKTLHLNFLSGPPGPAVGIQLSKTAGPEEEYALTDEVMYLYVSRRRRGVS